MLKCSPSWVPEPNITPKVAGSKFLIRSLPSWIQGWFTKIGFYDSHVFHHHWCSGTTLRACSDKMKTVVFPWWSNLASNIPASKTVNHEFTGHAVSCPPRKCWGNPFWIEIIQSTSKAARICLKELYESIMASSWYFFRFWVLRWVCYNRLCKEASSLRLRRRSPRKNRVSYPRCWCWSCFAVLWGCRLKLDTVYKLLALSSVIVML